MLERLEAAIGDVVLRALRRGFRIRAGATMRRYRGESGRVTRWLDAGTPERGTVVWMHGFNDRPDGFMRAASELVTDHRVVAPAVPGFFDGWTDPGETYDLESYARWLTPVLQHAVPEPFVLVGNSLGGAIALELAATQTLPLRGVVALNTAGMEVEGAPSIIDDFARGESPFEIRERAGVNRLFSRLLGRPVQVPFPFEAAIYQEMQAQVDWYAKLGADLAKSPRRVSGEGWSSRIDLAAIDVPVLVLWGERDLIFPVTHAEHLAEALPTGRLQRMPNVGHIAHVEAPSQLAAAIRGFVETLD